MWSTFGETMCSVVHLWLRFCLQHVVCLPYVEHIFSGVKAMEVRVWRIGDFAKEIGKHSNTVDGWFKQMEERKAHYVNRVHNEKVYDELDLQIATFIREKRDGKPVWALEAIFEDLPNHFNLRPFPVDSESTNGTQVLDMDAIRKLFMQEIAATVEEQLQEGLKEFTKLLPAPADPAAERQKRLNDLITFKRIERNLEAEAMQLWSTKPDSERLKRVGLLRKEEDKDKRDQFIKEYINKHFDDQLSEAYGFE